MSFIENRTLNWLQAREKCLYLWYILNLFLNLFLYKSECDVHNVFFFSFQYNTITETYTFNMFSNMKLFNCLSQRFPEILCLNVIKYCNRGMTLWLHLVRSWNICSIWPNKKNPVRQKFQKWSLRGFYFIFYFTSKSWQPCRGRWKVIRILWLMALTYW